MMTQLGHDIAWHGMAWHGMETKHVYSICVPPAKSMQYHPSSGPNSAVKLPRTVKSAHTHARVRALKTLLAPTNMAHVHAHTHTQCTDSYLLKTVVQEGENSDKKFKYEVGPHTLVEIGKRQVLNFGEWLAGCHFWCECRHYIITMSSCEHCNSRVCHGVILPASLVFKSGRNTF